MSIVFFIIGLIIGAVVVAVWARSRIGAVVLELEHEREIGAERLRQATSTAEQLQSSFKALSAEALSASMAQLTELAKSQLGAAQTEAKGEMEKRQLEMQRLVQPISERLKRVDDQLIALNKERAQTQGILATQLRSVAETQDKLRMETSALVTALRKPNTRGQWGQMQLRKVVELAGMVRHCDFDEQASFVGADANALRPDMVVNLPGGKQVPVDAKAPLQAVLDAYEAQDEETRLMHLRDHARLLRRHVKQLSDKAYWTGMETAPDFVVMFLPGEHLYSAALEADPELIEEAMSRRVLIATPTTLLALLHSVGYGWQQERVAESAQAISDLGRDLHGRIVKLSTLLATLGKRLNSTVNAYNETVGSYEARVLPGARRFAEHGAVGAGAEIPSTEQITVSARGVHVSAAEDERAAAAADLADLPESLFGEMQSGHVAARHLRAAE